MRLLFIIDLHCDWKLRFSKRSKYHILDVSANLNPHIHSDEGLQSETSVLLFFYYDVKLINLSNCGF